MAGIPCHCFVVESGDYILGSIAVKKSGEAETTTEAPKSDATQLDYFQEQVVFS